MPLALPDHHAPGPHAPACNPALRAQLHGLLQADQVDAAIEAGLMAWLPCPRCDDEDAVARQQDQSIAAVRQQLGNAWAARERYRARNARLLRRAAERDARRQPAQRQAAPSLPPAAAAALARARAKAAGKA